MLRRSFLQFRPAGSPPLATPGAARQLHSVFKNHRTREKPHRAGQLSCASAMDTCLRNILGKAAGLPIYRILGADRTRIDGG